MERTISGMVGKGSVNHNTRAFTAKNVDKERSINNIEFCRTDIKKVYHQLFDEALERYNAKQKRNDRKIDNYYEKIRQGKQEKLFHEVIFQIGNKDDMNAQSSDGHLAKEILIEFMEDFQNRNPNLCVFSAYLHMDEETPHLHIDFVPFVSNSKRGLDTRVSLKGALGEQGFKGGTRGATEWKQWIDSEKQELSRVMECHGLHWKQLGTHNKHLSVLDFEKQERQKEVTRLEQVISGGKEELSTIVCKQIEVGEEVERLVSDNKKLEQRQVKLQQEVERMVSSKTVMERNVHVYDEDEKWQLPEPGGFMSAKAYREKKAMPLVTRLKEMVKSLTVKCVQLMEQVKQLTDRVTNQNKQINHLTKTVTEQMDTIENMQEKGADLKRLERYLGKEKVQVIVRLAKEQERAEKANKQLKRRFDRSR